MNAVEIEKIISDVVAIIPDIWDLYLDIKNGKSVSKDVSALLEQIADDIGKFKKVKQ